MSFSAVVSGGSGKIGSQLIHDLIKKEINILSLCRGLKSEKRGLTSVNVDLSDLTNTPEKTINNWAE